TADPESQPDSRVVATSLAANSYHALINHQNKCSGNMCSADAYEAVSWLHSSGSWLWRLKNTATDFIA
ncbi:hypothetical protein, partial [Zwartia vadi]|uniref:hypothetical protein n=1 Tax=Zwartia vadi TaxID=3058168 RepID=UPI0025B2A019